MPHDRTLQVGVGVVFACLVVAIVPAGRGELLEPSLEIVDEAILPVVHEHPGGDVHRRNQDGAFLHPALVDDLRDFVSDANKLLTLLGFEPEVVRMDEHLGLIRAFCSRTVEAPLGICARRLSFSNLYQ